MNVSSRFLLALALTVTASPTISVHVAQAQDAPPVKTFDSDADLNDLKASGGQMHRENGILHLELPAGDGWPQMQMKAAAPLDWRGQALSLDVKNAGQNPVEVGLRVDDDASADGWKHSWTDNTTIKAGETQKLIFDLGASPMQFGMRALPPVAAIQGARALKGTGEKPLDLSHITGWQLFVHAPKETVNLEIDNLGLIKSPSSDLSGIVDEWGQFSHADWPGKVHEEAEFGKRRDAEEKALSNFKPSDALDRFGGWKAGPALRASGFFRTEKVDGKWWLVDPDGHLFFSSGVDVVQPLEATMIAGRETMFQNVPPTTSELGFFRRDATDVLRGPTQNGLAYSFSGANLWRKYGPDWQKRWQTTALQRLQSYGFNTLGNWTSDELKAPDAAPRIPYVATAGIYGDHARISDGDDYWAKMHDAFDPKFPDDVHRSLQEITDKVKNDPYCIGYFVENEMSWGDSWSLKRRYGLAMGALNLDMNSPAKRVFLRQLKAKYGESWKLNTAWKTGFANWQALEAPYHAPDEPNEAMQVDLAAFSTSLAEKYFSTVAGELKKLAPNHLYLGCRFANRTPEAVAAAAKYCDVVSFNIYQPRLDEKEWAFVGDMNKPAIIGEFHMGATDRGLFSPGLVEAKSQDERAQMFKSYVKSVLDNPNFVGCHWFQYSDQPLTGRVLDGENYNIGFVDVTDTPYPEMVNAAREVNGEIYTRRHG